MHFSVCIPNYNYGRFIGETLSGLLAQSFEDFEVVVSDNASTDESAAVVRSFADPRVRLGVNACNVGFAANLDRAVGMARGDFVLLMPSDDLVAPNLLAEQARFQQLIGTEAERAVVSTTMSVVDPAGALLGASGPDARLWRPTDRAAELEASMGFTVYRVEADTLLKRCLDVMANPFNLNTTCYPRALWQEIEGYRGSHTINPDKWFHWRLLGVAKTAYFLDTPLASCREHAQNQNSLQARAGVLRYLVDDYRSTFELDKALLERLGMTREQLEERFVEYDIARHGLATLATGDRAKARRIARFGEAVYPEHARRNAKTWMLRALLWAGPAGEALAKAAYGRYRATKPRGDSDGADQRL